MPPDPSLAVGPTGVVETTNDALYVFSRTGASLGSADLYSLTGATPSNTWAETDPRVVYDSSVGHFYLSVLGYDPTSCASQVYLLRSDSSDPTGGWHGFVLFNQTAGTSADQPALGFSSNVVTLTWNDFSCPGGTGGSSQMDVVQKGDLLSLSTSATTADAFLNGPASPQPVVTLGTNGVQYVAYNGSYTGTGYVGVFAITGTPQSSNVVVGAEQRKTISATQAPGGSIVAALQKNTTARLVTGDDRLDNAVWQNGTIWTADSTQCTPGGDSAPRSCLNVLSLAADTSGSVTTVAQVQTGVLGTYLYYPAVSVDLAGNAYVAYDQSSATTFESLQVAGVSGTGMSAPTPVHTSTTYYNPGGGACSSAGCRWGDYSGAAQDPSHPSDVWVVSEDTDGTATAACGNSAQNCWNSYLARLTYASPAVTSVTPAAGPTTGGQSVTINGSDFGSTSAVTLGGTAATITNLTPDSIQITTPAHAAGLVQAQVCDPSCSSLTPPAPSSAGYVYVPSSRFHPLSPTRVVDTRSAYCKQCTTGYLRPGEVRNFSVSGYVPASATSVVLNVTSCGNGGSGCVGSSATYMTVFPTGTAQPGTSNINTPASRDIANLVTVGLGQGLGFSVYNDSGNHDLVVDVDGYYDATSGTDGLFHPLTAPQRVCDTRSGPANNCNPSGTGIPLRQGEARLVTVALGGSGIPSANAEAAVLNVTASGATTATYLTIYPPQAGTTPTCGGPPAGSNLNVPAGIDEPNRAIVPIDPASGTVCVFNANGTVNLVVDANGWYGTSSAPAGARFQAIGPTRVCDTRPWDGTACAGHSLLQSSTLRVLVAGVGGLPASGMVAVLANATAVSGSAATYMTVFPDGQPYPNTSDLNAPANVNIANMVIVGVPGDGQLDVTNANGTIDFLLDASGWFQ